MFVGEFRYKIDNKGRLPLPPKFRKEMGDSLVLTIVGDTCVTAYTKADWEKMTASQAPTGLLVSDNARRLNRYIFSNANEVSIDGQGRVALPPSLRERCGISSEAIIAGVNNYFEIWNPEDWKKQRLSSDEANVLVERLEERK